MEEQTSPEVKNFIRNIINDDLESKKHTQIITRFPPEPNGYLHIGHAKAICLSFGIAQSYQDAYCNLRFDDTNPEKEKPEYIEAIKKDIQWLGYKWEGTIKHASDYFDQLHDYAVQLIKEGKAYICELTAEEMREYRGTLKEGGKDSPYRNRPVEENLELFTKMREGKIEEGKAVLRAKIDMQAGNVNMRDPVVYRIKKAPHPMTGDKWCIYPMYDFTHCISDAIENITHSLCTLEFQDHRPLYDWFLDELRTPSHPRQIEFARLNLNYTITSKRKLQALVQDGHVDGWDDPRMPTICGLRRRGYPPKAIVDFCERIGVAKKETIIDMSMLEDSCRNELNETAPRGFCVLNPLKVVITNYDEGKEEQLSAPNHPQKPEMGTRVMPFAREVYIEQDDFMEEPPSKYFRLAPGKEVRLRYGYIIKCEEVIKDEGGNIIELRCTYDPNTLGKKPEGRKVKGIIHWVSKKHSVSGRANVFDRLFKVENPAAVEPFTDSLNPDSLHVFENAQFEPCVAAQEEPTAYQFERLGYFYPEKNSSKEHPVFNRTVTLRDSWK